MTRIQVENIQILCNTSFDREHNAVHLPRKLSGDFTALAWDIHNDISEGDAEYREKNGYFTMRDNVYTGMLRWHATNAKTAEEAQAAQKVLDDLNTVNDLDFPAFLRIVMPGNQLKYASAARFHRDGYVETMARGRLLCCYNGAATEYVENGALRVFGLGDMWRHAARRDPSGAKAFPHRAPACNEPRLVLVGDI